MLLRKILGSMLSVMLVVTQFVPLIGLAALVTTQTACPSSKDVSGAADLVAREIDRALPLLRSRGISTVTLEKVRDNAVRVKEAFNSGDSSSTVDRMNDLLDAFDAVVSEIERISDKTTQTIILLALYGVRRYVDSLADSLAKAAAKVPASTSRGAVVNRGAKIEEFRKRKDWQCRNSASGRYESMDYCKANPSTSQVETR